MRVFQKLAFWRKLRRPLSLIIAFVLVLLPVMPVNAHQDPASCNASGLQQTPIISPSSDVYHGDLITYTVTYSNLDPDGAGPASPCNVTNAKGSITLPNGVVVNVVNGATLNVGDSLACPGGPGCAAGPYTYTVNHADEVSGSVTAAFNISGVLHQDANEETASDQDTLSRTVIHPSTITTITASPSQVQAGGTVDLTVTEQNDGDVALTSPSVTVDNGVGTLSAPPDSGDVANPGVLDPGETWSWTINNVVVAGDTTFTATGHGLTPAPLTDDVTWCADPQNPPANTFCDQDEQDTVEVTVVNPSTMVTITSSASTVTAGGTVDLTIAEQNDGGVPLTNASVVVDNGVGSFNSATPGMTGDIANPGVLDPGETWTWIKTGVVVAGTTTYMATGHGTTPLGDDVTWCTDPQNPPANTFCDQDERDAVTVMVEDLSCTYTQGYWKNHSSYGPAAHPNDTWLAVTPSGPDSPFYLSGMSWLKVFNTPVKGNAYYNLAHQFMAAWLNIENGASTTPAVDAAMTQAQTLLGTYTPAQIGAMKGNNPTRQQFINLAGILGSYNEGQIGPGHCDN